MDSTADESGESISSRSFRVRQLFRDAIKELELRDRDSDQQQDDSAALSRGVSSRDVEDARDRFSLWAGNLGALKPPKSRLSLDYRFIDAEETSERVCELLDELADALCDLMDIINQEPFDEDENRSLEGDELAGDTDVPRPVLQPDQAPDESVEDASDTSYELAATEIDEGLDEARTVLEIISEYLKSLFQIAVSVRKSGTRDKFKHALQVSCTPFTDVLDVNHLHDRHPKLPDQICTALGGANAKRRQFIKYCRDHSTRLTVEHEQEAPAIHPTPSRPARTELLSSKATTFAPENTSFALAAAEQEPDLDEDDAFSQVSASTFSGENQVLSLPRLSTLSLDGGQFECPICRTFQSFRTEAAWRRHVFRELKAYACTFGCGEMYGDRNAWFEHELQVHRSRYMCRLCAAPDSFSEAELKSHIAAIHGEFHKEDLQMLLDSGREPINRFSPEECPFCNEWAAKLQEKVDPKGKLSEGQTCSVNISASRFRRHVAAHQEQLTIFAVPREADDNSDAGTPDPGTVGSVSAIHSPFTLDEMSEQGFATFQEGQDAASLSSHEISDSDSNQSEVIRGPTIEREVITHYRNIDHGVIHAPKPPSPPPLWRILNQREVEITRDTDIDITRSRSRHGETWGGATRDWTIVDVPLGTERVRMEAASDGAADVTWKRYSGVRRARFIPERNGESTTRSATTTVVNDCDRVVETTNDRVNVSIVDKGNEIEIEETKQGRLSQRKNDDMWTEITKDLVIREAIEEMGYDYEESGPFFYIMQYLLYEDVLQLVNLSDDIRRHVTARSEDPATERQEKRPRTPIQPEIRDKCYVAR